MSRNVLLVLPNAADASTVREWLLNWPDGQFQVEWANRCASGVDRLLSVEGERVAAIVVDPLLSDSQGLDTFERLFKAAPHIPILLVSRARDEGLVRQAVRCGAQDYLLWEQLDGDALPKAVNSMLERTAHSEARFVDSSRAQLTLDSIGDAIVSTDVAGNVTYLNRVAESMTGWSGQEAAGRPLQEVLRIIDAHSREPARNPLALAILEDRTVGLSANSVMIRRDGHECAIEDTAAPIHDQRGQVTGAVIVFHDVSVARAMSVKMSYLAQHDSLTGLPNRMLFNDRLTQALAHARRHRTSLAVLYMDVDRFKHINDTQGHAVGDQILQLISRRLVACVRSSDTVSRHGGDEFVVLLSEVAGAADAAHCAEKIGAAMDAQQSKDPRDVHVTVSIGISVYPKDGIDAETLLTSADAALMRAKAHGRGNHQLFEPAIELSSDDRSRQQMPANDAGYVPHRTDSVGVVV